MVIGNCALVFLTLLVASMLMQFVRARKRKRLVLQVNHALLSAEDQERWNSVNRSFDFMFKDFRKLQIMKKNAQQLPDGLVRELDRYRLFSKFELLVTASMLLFGVSAYSFCN